MKDLTDNQTNNAYKQANPDCNARALNLLQKIFQFSPFKRVSGVSLAMYSYTPMRVV